MSGKPAPLFSKVWKTAAADEAAAGRLAAALGVPRAAARLLAGRGFSDPDGIDAFLRPRLSALGDPFRLPAMDRAVGRIWRALDAGQKLVVFGDYDVDGITSTALLLSVLRPLGAQVEAFLPHRMDEGYGLTLDALERCVAEHRPALVITVDCGTASAAAVEWAAARGIDVIVTDHHAPGESVAPAVAVVNPKLGAHEEDRILAGVGVAFKLAHALLKRGRETGRAQAALDLKEHLDLVALGTVADIVPLQGENRTFVRHGLGALAGTKKTGLRALMDVAGVGAPVDAHDIGFKLGPRLNAAGRLGDALKALELLTTDDPGLAVSLAKHLHEENGRRQEVEKKIVEEAMAELDAGFDPASQFGLVVAREGWHPGVIGIVASRLVQRYARPAIVIALNEGVGRGSCRSIEDFDIQAALAECGGALMKFGGHAMAAGLEVGVAQLEGFAGHFNRVASARLSGRDLRPTQRIDVWLDALADADARLLAFLEEARPFGVGNTTPVWGCRAVRVTAAPRRVGGGQHLKLLLAQGGAQREAIWFGAGEREVPGVLDVAFQLRRNDYFGDGRVDLMIQDARPAE